MSGVRKAAIRSGSCGTDAAHLWYIKLGKHLFLMRPLCLHLPADTLHRLPWAWAFLCSSSGLHSAKPPPKPYHLIKLTFTVNPLVLPACVWDWLWVLKLLQTAEETVISLCTESSRLLPPQHCLRNITDFIKIAENDNISVIITCFFSISQGFWNDVLLWITGNGRKHIAWHYCENRKRTISNRGKKIKP